MQRIQTINISNAEGQAKDLLTGLKQAMGKEVNIFGVIANSANTLKGFLDFKTALDAGVLTGLQREQIALALAGLNGCTYCASAHSFISSSLKLSSDEIEKNLKADSSDEKTKQLLVFVREVVKNRGHIDEQVLQAVQSAGFSDEAIVEIIGAIALNTFTNYFNEVFSVEVDFPKVDVQKSV